MSEWTAWSRNLDQLAKVYRRPDAACGMVTDAELSLAEQYARYSYTGAGKIVELGCWMGAITLALARGVADNPQKTYKRPIDTIDRFRWEPWMTPIAERLGCPRVADGDSFRAYTEAVLEPYKHLIQIREKDLLEPDRIREPIEFLFVDAMKSWPLANAIARTYFPRLIAGRALIVQQDFAYHHVISATNHILMWLVRDRVEPVYHAPGSYSVVFFVKQAFERRSLPILDPTEVTIDMAEQAWAYSDGFLRGEAKRDVWLCKVLFFVEQGWLDAAFEEAQRFVHTTGPAVGEAVDDIQFVVARQAEALGGSAERSKVAEVGRLLCDVRGA